MQPPPLPTKSTDTLPPQPGPVFQGPPGWWFILLGINLFMVIVPACSEHLQDDRDSGLRSIIKIRTTLDRLSEAFHLGFDAGLQQISFEMAYAFGMLFLATIPALAFLVVTLFTRNWAGFRTWCVCFFGTILFGVAFMIFRDQL